MGVVYSNKVGSQFNDVIDITDAFVNNAFGLAGDDLYLMRTFFDGGGFSQIKEEANQGKDTVRFSLGGANISYFTPENIENVEVLANGSQVQYDITGNALNNLIKVDGTLGQDSKLVLNGGDGNDTLIGGGVLNEYTQPSSLLGGGGNDSLLGGNGVDQLVGGAGNDTMSGGDGNDFYDVESVGDVLIETIADDTSTMGIDGGFDKVYSSVSFTLAANLESLTLLNSATALIATGNASANDLFGNGNNNVLVGLDGNDQLVGNEGNDSLDGGAGNDYLRGDNGNDTVRGGDGNDLLDGSSGLDLLDAGAGNDIFYSFNSDKDTLIGGAGDDTFFVESEAILQESANGGTDTVYLQDVGYGYVLADNIENLILTIDSYSNVRGNLSNNRIEGNSSADRIEGMAGDDVLVGLGGSDTLLGGAGNDTYYVQDNDFLDEKANEGTDTVISNISFTLGVNLENLTLTNTAFLGKGNDGKNFLRGNENVNQLWGGAGDDTLDGGRQFSSPFGDTLFGGAGSDTYIVNNFFDLISGELAQVGTEKDTVISSLDYTLGLNLENLTLAEGSGAVLAIGNAAANKLVGNSGDNVLSGGKGNDSMEGGKGDDIYIVGQVADVVKELLNEGQDTVRVQASLTTYKLGDNLENLQFLVGGVAGVKGTGNGLNNNITSGIGEDTLEGLAGNDSINAGAGSDSLSGGDGNDTLDGGKDVDSLAGGLGDDVYYVDSLNDVITESANQGKDVVFSQIDGYTLGANVDDLMISGISTPYGFAYVKSGTGNALNNRIISNSTDVDILNGLGGDDTLDGGAGADMMTGGKGNDTYILSVEADQTIELTGEGTDSLILNFSSGEYNLANNIENARRGDGFTGKMVGNSLVNELVGASGVDELDAGAASSEKDILKGGAGSDIYTINFGKVGAAVITNDTVIENLNEGANDIILIRLDNADTLAGSASYTLGANIEALAFESGASALNTGVTMSITGNALDNNISANEAANRLQGLAGNDGLSGLGGNDTIDGGEGNDFLSGGDGNDSLFGGTGNDFLNGGSGLDVMSGAAGNDTYRLDNDDSLASGAEVAGGGTDRMEFYSAVEVLNIDMNLTKYGGGFVEDLLLRDIRSGGSTLTATGNKLDNQITYINNDSNDVAVLNGGDGNDTLSDGDSVYSFSNQITMTGDAGNDVLNSWHFSNNDQFHGGAGDDDVLNVYLSLYSASSASFSAGGVSGIEKLNLQYFDSYNGIGASYSFNVLGNTFSDGISISRGVPSSKGHTADIRLLDVAANQRLISDHYVGTLGLDGVVDNQTVQLYLDGGDIDLFDTGSSQIKTLQITSNAGNQASVDFLNAYQTLDTITVSGEVDLSFANLDKSQGHHVSFQGAGGFVELDAFDVQAIDISLDNSNLVLENSTAAEALNVAVVSASQLDVLRYEGDLNVTGNQDLTINGGHDQINATAFSGNLTLMGVFETVSIQSGSGQDTITGGSGNDLIAGGAGADILTGGGEANFGGNDIYFFNAQDYQAGVDVDTLTDFLGGDQIVLDVSFFSTLSFDGSVIGESTLQAGELFYGSIDEYEANSSSNQNLIYDFSIGALYYDANGKSGMGEASDAVQILQITSGANLNNFQILYNQSGV